MKSGGWIGADGQPIRFCPVFMNFTPWSPYFSSLYFSQFPRIFLCQILHFVSALPSDHPCCPFTFFCPASSFSFRSSNLSITSPRKLPSYLSFFVVVYVLTYLVLSLLLNDSLLSSLASDFSFIRLPPITFIFLFISSHFTSCVLCEVSAISTQLTSGAPLPYYLPFSY